MRAALLAALLAVVSNAQALELAGVFADHMVLQRDAPLRVWGQAEAGQRVRVQLAGRSASAQSGKDGRWQATLAPLKAGGPHRLQVSAGAEQRSLDDVLIGDVWIAAGQSNMEWRLADASNAAAEIAAAGEPRLRHAKMPHRVGLTPLRDAPPLRWDVSSPATAADFSAVAYHFARRVQADVNVPIGILNLSWGGTHVETWTSPRTNATDPELAGVMRAMPADAAAFVQRRRDLMLERISRFQGGPPGAAVAQEGKTWPTLNLPQVWETQGLRGFDGQVWLRRHVTLTAAEAAGPATLHAGLVDDCDESFVNGQAVGKTCGWETPRAYPLPAGLLREGDNLIAIRVTDTGGDGGIHGPAAHLRLETSAGAKPLAGRWQAHVESVQIGEEPGPNDMPSLLFNGMVRPFTSFAARGVIWYQGETNAPRAARYVQAFPRLIQDWRAEWGKWGREQGQRGTLPFYFVQLSSYGPRPPLPEGSAFAELRDAQRQALRLPATGMAVSIDVGDANDIHPRDKRSVGERLARIALAQTYAKPMPFKGPTLRASRMRPDGQFELTFADVAGGLATRGGGPLLGFAVAGDDQRFVPAQAEIVGGDRVRVWSLAVGKPAAVRYAWGDSPLEANLVDGAGLPATPWRSDRWPLVTRDIRPEF